MLPLFAILGIALAIRLYSVAFGLPALNDPDELTFELGAIKMLGGGHLNPGWFGHPATTTMYVLAALTILVFTIGYLLGRFPTIDAFSDAIYANPSWVILPGRIAMVLFAVATIYLTYRLTRELFDRHTALVAAVFLTVNPVHVTWSQIIRSDMMACFFMLLGILSALRIARTNRWRDYVFAALWVGAATATKWPYALTGIPVLGAVALCFGKEPSERGRILMWLSLFGAMAMGFLLLISPYLLLDHETVLRNIRGEAQAHHLGATGGTPWENAWWYLAGPLATGFGSIGLIFAGCGLVLFSQRREAAVILLPLLSCFFVLLCLQNLVWERWVLALIPLLAIAAAACISSLTQLVRGRLPHRHAYAIIAVAVTITLLSPSLRAHNDARARLNDTRQLASRWALTHIKPGDTVLLEHFAFDILPQPWRFLFPLGDIGCVNVRAMLGNKVQLSTVQSKRGSRANVDYGTVSKERHNTCRANYAILTQADRYAAERTVFPAEDAAYRELIARGTIVASFTPEAGKIGGPIVRIVRFTQ